MECAIEHIDALEREFRCIQSIKMDVIHEYENAYNIYMIDYVLKLNMMN